MSDDNNNLDAAMKKEFESMKPTSKRSTGAKDGEPAQAQVIVRTTNEERERWKEAASKAGLSMSEWIRSMCTKEAFEVLECQHRQEDLLIYPWSTTCLKCGHRLVG